MSTSILARYWFQGESQASLASRLPEVLMSAGFRLPGPPGRDTADALRSALLAEDVRNGAVELIHPAAGIDGFVSMREAGKAEGSPGLLLTLKTGSARFGSPLEKGYYPASGVLFEAAALAVYQQSTAVYGYLTAADFEVASKLKLPGARYNEALAMEWQAVSRRILLSLYSVNYLSEPILERYPLLQEAEDGLVRRVQLRENGLMIALSRCFIWDERVTPEQFSHESGISQAWRGGSWATSGPGKAL
jgi:hypothetical protein